MNKTFGIIAKGSAIVLSITLLSGCKWFAGKQEEKKEAAPTAQAGTSTVLVSINGKPVIRESDFLTNINQMLQANPYFRGAGADSLPMSIKRKFLDELLKQELILADAEKKNIAQDPEFIKAYNEMILLVKRSLTIQFFEKRIYDNIKVADSDIAKHFEENKSRYVKEQGGILASGAKFDNDSQASKFFDKVKNDIQNFEKAAKEDKNAKFRSFDRISKEESKEPRPDKGIPAPIKEAVLAMSSFPKVEKVKVGDATWVIAAFDKKEPVYFELSEIKPQIEGIIKNNEFRKVLDDELKALRTSVTIDIFEDYFKEKEAAPQDKASESPAAAAQNEAGANVTASA